jgi:hypothetical protein
MQTSLNNLIPHHVAKGLKGPNVGAAERIASGVIALAMIRQAWQGGIFSKIIIGIPAIAALRRAITGHCEAYEKMGYSSLSESGSHHAAGAAIPFRQHGSGARSPVSDGDSY